MAKRLRRRCEEEMASGSTFLHGAFMPVASHLPVARSRAAKRPRQSEFFCATVGPAVEALLLADGDLRAHGDAASVHAARVAARKLRTDLGLLRELLDAAWVADVRAQLKRLSDLLGAVRDLDVLMTRVQAIGPRLPAENADAVSPMLARLRAARERADLALRAQLGAFWYRELLGALATVIRDAGGGQLAVPNERVRARKIVARIMQHAMVNLERAVVRAGNAADATRLHRIRICAKTCRYAAEALSPFVPAKRKKRLQRFLRGATRLQQRLGDIRDAVLEPEALRHFAAVEPAVLDEIRTLENVRATNAWQAGWKRVSSRKSRFW